jgi:hypothetical protein
VKAHDGILFPLVCPYNRRLYQKICLTHNNKKG